jgi:hypothetical protein
MTVEVLDFLMGYDEYRSQVGVTNKPENIVIRYVSYIYRLFTGLSLRLRADI